MLTLRSLNECYKEAINSGCKYVGVILLYNDGSDREDIIINKNKDFEHKMDFWNITMDNGLAYKYDDIMKITAFAHGNSFQEVENKLLGVSNG